jgi:hypothetical protein
VTSSITVARLAVLAGTPPAGSAEARGTIEHIRRALAPVAASL